MKTTKEIVCLWFLIISYSSDVSSASPRHMKSISGIFISGDNHRTTLKENTQLNIIIKPGGGIGGGGGGGGGGGVSSGGIIPGSGTSGSGSGIGIGTGSTGAIQGTGSTANGGRGGVSSGGRGNVRGGTPEEAAKAASLANRNNGNCNPLKGARIPLFSTIILYIIIWSLKLT